MTVTVKDARGVGVTCEIEHGRLPAGTLGLTDFGGGAIPKIRISPEAFVDGPEVYLGVLAHELAHVVSHDASHGRRWKSEALRLKRDLESSLGTQIQVESRKIAKARAGRKGGK